jgi:sugar/nucleoside kinase (ribokinase family)
VLLAILEGFGIGTSRIVYSPALPTSKTVILLVAGQDRRFIHSFGANAGFTVSHIDRAWVQSLDIFYLGGLFLMPAFDPHELLDLLGFCRQHGVTSVVDVVIPQNQPVSADLGPLLKAIDYFLPNDDEAQYMTGYSDPFDQLRAFNRLGANTVVITRGRKGAIVGKGQDFWQSGIYEITNPVDPSGCGDAFAAGLVYGISKGWDLGAVVRYGSALGASAITALGTTSGVFTATQAEAFIATHSLQVTSGKL